MPCKVLSWEVDYISLVDNVKKKKNKLEKDR